MQGFDPANSFGAAVAARYDDQPRGDESAAVQFLHTIAPQPTALEFAIGTGRIALPLAASGMTVDGIELSPAMIARLQAKFGGDAIRVVHGDMSRVQMGQRYGLVYLVFNTIFNLLTADDQIRCFANAAQHITDDGVFVVETALPHAWMPSGKSDYVHAEQVNLDSVMFDVARYDPVSQHLIENHVHISPSGISMQPIVCRLITPGEMDLMARMAGLQLVQRFANWQQTPFDAQSTAHVSVYAHQRK
ncbi:MAG: class I SAM-dependent methyltransferase [Chloroflexia bacterium]|nr:class I SAM-dependent methyltransferase [Chloroflexia bacterium]